MLDIQREEFLSFKAHLCVPELLQIVENVNKQKNLIFLHSNTRIWDLKLNREIAQF